MDSVWSIFGEQPTSPTATAIVRGRIADDYLSHYGCGAIAGFVVQPPVGSDGSRLLAFFATEATLGANGKTPRVDILESFKKNG